ncbi:hypothetical protein PVAP13_5NG354081 [Panicum virgatum]|uniref:RNase H type-1 domain-containing protein n=1 Tax=Panicum virgatum TaxID=38727 RepID=A0A8T0RS88_PANVG|nr:hypothetical protein PVAP13_5NG354081 [Panicum virgatum]
MQLQIGDGVNLNMWFDPWIPRDMSRRPITPRGAVLLRDVSELIDPVIVLVRNIFWEEDARIILSIPVHAGMENRVAWHFEMKGAFSVKSAYKVFRKEQITHSRKDEALDHERSWSLLGLNREREALLLKRIAREVIEALMNLREQEKAKCCYVLWICWFEHNRVREGEPRRDASCLSHSIQIRYDEGDVVSARRGRVESLMCLHGELIAVIQGTDAVEVVQAVYSQAFYFSLVTFLVEELRGILEMNFISWRVQQRPRSCNNNRVAHELATLGSMCEPDADYVVAPIPDIIACIIADGSALSD